MPSTERDISQIKLDQSRRPLWYKLIGVDSGNDQPQFFLAYVGGPAEATHIIHSDPSCQNITGPWQLIIPFREECERLSLKFGECRQIIRFVPTAEFFYPQHTSLPIIDPKEQPKQ